MPSQPGNEPRGARSWELQACHFPEVRIGKNPLQKLPFNEVDIGGSHRAIVSIQVHHVSGAVSFGSGVLVSDNVIVTAAHVLLPHLLPGVMPDAAKQVSVSAGLGHPDSTIERQQGAWALVHSEWADRPYDPSYRNDIGLIRLSGKFCTVKPLRFKAANVSGGNHVGVVYGYPDDDITFPTRKVYKPVLFKSQSGFRFAGVEMLEHEADTDLGSSGGPFIVNDDDRKKRKVIAIHSCSQSKSNGSCVNKAVPFNHNGNDVGVLVHIAKHMMGSSVGTREMVDQDGVAFMVEVVNKYSFNEYSFKWRAC